MKEENVARLTQRPHPQPLSTPREHLIRPAAEPSPGLRPPSPTDWARGISPSGAEQVTPSELAVEPFIDKREVARRMGRTVRAVDNLMRDGLIPYYRFDWRVAFRWSEIQAHLAQNCRVSGRES